MNESQSATDLRIIDEMREEIESHGVPYLPGSLRSFVRTERGKRVASMLERLARELSAEKWARKMDAQSAQRTLEAQQNSINSEREMNHQLTTELQRLQEKRA
jgi:sugar phosphate isomerase/epimerase